MVSRADQLTVSTIAAVMALLIATAVMVLLIATLVAGRWHPAGKSSPESAVAAAPTRDEEQPMPADDQIIDVIPRDRIPAIFRPTFVPASAAKIPPDARVIGYTDQGEAHAYALNLLNGHEIVNDVVGGQKIAATW